MSQCDDRRRPLAVDLFAGAGGLSLGLEQAGFDVVAAVEYDPVHAAVHEFNFGMTEVLCRDVAQLDASELRAAAEIGRAKHGHTTPWDGEIDLVAGGPPCQGFSLIGKRLVDDPRNDLVFHFFRLVKDLRPRMFVMENVPGMRIGGHGSILEQLVVEFEDEGYRIVRPIELLNAAEFGVPQDRSRVFLLGAREDQALPMYPARTTLPAPGRRRPAATLVGAPPCPTVRDALADIPNLDEFDALLSTDEVELPEDLVEQCLAAASRYALALRGLEPDPEDRSHPRIWNPALLTSSTRTKHTDLSISRFSATPPGTVEPVSRFLRLDPEGVCNTLRAGTGSERGAYTSPRPIHPFLPRVISVREAARLHSFPDWFRFHRTKWHGFRQIGNAVTPLVGRAVGRALVDSLGAKSFMPEVAVPLGDTTLLSLSMAEAATHFGADKSSIPPPRKRVAAAA